MRTSTGLLAPVLGLALIATACGGSDAPASDAGIDADAATSALSCEPASGSRVRLKVIEGDGASVVEGFHDDTEATDCAIATAADGTTRCLPSPAATGSVFFLDAACTTRLLLPSVPADPPLPFFRENIAAADGCGVVPVFSPVGDKITFTGVETLYAGSPAACTAVTAAAADYYQLDAPVADNKFQAMTLSPTDSEGRITFSSFDGADGSRTCIGVLHDGDLDEDCAATVAEDGAIRCLPAAQGGTAVFTDAACANPADVVIFDASCGATPVNYSSEVNASVCFPRTKLRELAADIAPPVYSNPGVCTEVALGVDQTVIAIAASVSPFSFAELSRSFVGDGGRLERGIQQSGSLELQFNRFHDSQVDTICAFQTLADGSLRCGPAATVGTPLASVQSFFSDAACTLPIEVGVMAATCVDTPAAYAVQPGALGLRVLPVMGPLVTGIFQMGVTCDPVDTTGGRFLQLGPEVDPTTFAEGVRRTE